MAPTTVTPSHTKSQEVGSANFGLQKFWPPESPKKSGYVLDPKVLCWDSHIHFLIRLCASVIYVKQRHTVTPSDVLQYILSEGISLPVPVAARSKP